MSSKPSKSGSTNRNAQITNFFRPAPPPPQPPAAGRETNTTVTSSSPTQRLLVRVDHNLPETNITENSKSATASTNTSFSETSMPGSQGTTKSRVVPSSDGEESDDSLEDPFEMLRRQKREESASGAKKKDLSPRSPIGAPKKPVISEAAKAPTYTFSLGNLVAQKAKSDILQQEKLLSRALFEKANREVTDDSRGGDQPIEQGMLEDALGQGTAKRLMAALNRKDAWRVDKSWHFFDMDKDYRKSRKNPFPKETVGSGWEAGLTTARGRQQLFLSGFVQDMAKIDSVPSEEVLLWMLDELCLESREDLAYAYFNVLHVLPAPVIEKLITEERVSRLFCLLGGKNDALDTQKQVILVNAERIDDREGNFYNTRLVTSLFGKIARIIYSNHTVIKKTCILLVRLALDVRIAKQAEVRSSIEDSLTELFESISDEDWPEISQQISLNLISTILDAPYRLRALNALPVHTPRIHLLRRRLALSYLWDDPTYLTKQYSDLVRISCFSQLLAKPQFEINKSTDYADLQSHISIMDIAIDDGPTSGRTRENDAEVDVLVERLRNMFSGIYDTNAQNLARTEAKDTIERLVFRLRFAVRIKDKTNLVVETDTGPEWVGRDGKVQARLPWGGKSGDVNGA